MTTLQETLRAMFVEKVAHCITDSGGVSGRAYQRNATRDFDAEPEAILEHGFLTVSLYHHLNAVLDLDKRCIEFNKLPCEAWDSDMCWGISFEQEKWLKRRAFWVNGPTWNTYNWENNFDQTLQGRNLERDGETYVLLQIHGGADVRMGYTDAKLFKIYDHGYFLDDSASFDVCRAQAEAAGYPPREGEWDYLTLDWRRGSGFDIWDPNLGDSVELPDDFLNQLPEQRLIGTAQAVHH